MIAVLTGLSEEADTVDQRDGVLVLTGFKALADMDTLIPADCEAIISWGTAGSLTAAVPVGSIVILETVIDADGNAHDSDPAWRSRIVAAFPEIRIETGYSGPVEVATTAATKAALAAKYKVATVDMGAYACMQFAGRRNIPWAAVQGISDAFDQTVPLADAMNQDGTADVQKAAQEIAADPDDIRGAVRVLETFEDAIDGLDRCYAAVGPWLSFHDY
jgi:nucleoside phosphorylase